MAKAALIRRGCSRIVFVSPQLRDSVASRLGFDPADCAVIPNGIDVTSFEHQQTAPLRADLTLPADAILVGAVGNLRRPKGYDVLLRATRIAIDRVPRLHVVIAGDTSGTVYPEISALRGPARLEAQVNFLGLRSDVPAILRSLDLYVLSSNTEGFSIACCEAMAAGVPISGHAQWRARADPGRRPLRPARPARRPGGARRGGP